MQHRCFAASGLLPLVLIEMLIVAAALLAIGSSLTATIRGIATVQADPLRGRRPSVPSSAHGSQQATSMGWRQVRGIRPSNVWTPLHRKPATYRVEYNAVGELHVWESPHTDTCVHIGHRVARPVFVPSGSRAGHRMKPQPAWSHSAHVGECDHTRRYVRLQRAREKS